jgi:plastocyanin
MGNFGYAAVGIIVALVVTGGLLYMFYARSNAVEKAGSSALIMLAVVSLMIPVFWIMEGNNQASAKELQHSLAVQRGMGLYAQYCIEGCYVVKDNKIVDPKYNGYTIAQLNQMSDDDLHRIIDGGVYNPAVPQPSNKNAIVFGESFNGPLSSNDVEYLFQFLRSADPEYLQKNGYASGSSANGFNKLADFLQNGSATAPGNPSAYATAVALGKAGQFGVATDMTKTNHVTMNIVSSVAGRSCQPACYQILNLQVKVGTVITWINQSPDKHTVSALYGDGSNTAKLAPQIFDSGFNNGVKTGGQYSYTVTEAAYKFNTNHTVVYYCQYHPAMLAELTIVQ